MAKKGKSLLTVAAVSALAAGAYYLYKKKSTEIAVDMDDDEDIDSFSDDDMDEKTVKRPYVSLDFNTVEQKVKDAASKVADVAGTAAVSLGDMLKKGEEKVEEFFDDRKAESATEVVGVDDLDDVEDELEETVSDALDTAEETAEEIKEAASEVFFSDAQ